MDFYKNQEEFFKKYNFFLSYSTGISSICFGSGSPVN